MQIRLQVRPRLCLATCAPSKGSRSARPASVGLRSTAARGPGCRGTAHSSQGGSRGPSAFMGDVGSSCSLSSTAFGGLYDLDWPWPSRYMQAV